MAAYKAVDVVRVFVWDRYVGAVTSDPRLGSHAFQFDPVFARTGIELAPIHMPLLKAAAPFVFPELPDKTYMRLPAMLADSLPDKFGNALIDAWMARKGIPRDRITPLDRLAYMGKRGMGALEFKPPRGSQEKNATAIRMSHLVEEARKVVTGNIGDEHHTGVALRRLIQVGTSAGGARAKAVIAWNPGTNEVRPGQFDVEEGFEHWILKFDGLKADGAPESAESPGRIEYAYYEMARAAGIRISECRLMEEGGRAHFMTRRFDREGNKKIHMQSLCAMDHMDYKRTGVHDYAQVFQVLNRLKLGMPAFEEMFRRMTFNVMACNCDDHSRNIAFLLRENGGWELAPAFDLTFSYDSSSRWIYQHFLSVNGKFDGVTANDLHAVANQVGIGRAPQIVRQVREAVEAWPDFAVAAGVDPAQIKEVRGRHTLFSLPRRARARVDP